MRRLFGTRGRFDYAVDAREAARIWGGVEGPPLALIAFGYFTYAVNGWPHCSTTTPVSVGYRIISGQTGTPAFRSSGWTLPWVGQR